MKEEDKKNHSPLISIITVVYNGEKYLEQTIQSVLNQTYKNIEYIIIDGGSSDGTHGIIKKYEDFISYWVSEQDNGLYDAMNKGIKIAKGELIGIINSDDWYELDTVEIMVNAYKKYTNKSIFHADRYNVYEDGRRNIKKFHPSEFKFKYYGMTYNHPSMFITKEEYSKHLYNTNLTALSDNQFVLETFLRDKTTIHYINQAVVNYRLDGISAKLTLKEKLKEGYIVRRNSGMGLLKSVFSFFFRFFVFMLYKPKK